MSEQLASILEEIVAEKHSEVAERSEKTPVELLENIIVEQDDIPRGFYESLLRKRNAGQAGIIAEIKKASPSKGVIRNDFDAKEIALEYEQYGATCLSVLTDEKFFQGSDIDLDAVRANTSLPILRKDFIVHEYQIFESRTIGADCILLIAACLTRDEVSKFSRLAYDLGMDVLVEIHNTEELEKIAGLPVRMIGINNRNLHTFEINLDTSFDLSVLIPNDILVISESGIKTSEEIKMLSLAGIHGFLIGESLMKAQSPGEELKNLFI